MRNRSRHSDHREERGRGHHGGIGGGPSRRRGGGRHGKPRGGRGRARRGEARYILLDALRDGPKHGYEIIKTLEERSAGEYVPSPGTVYPTLQYLEDQGLVSASEETDRRVYQLTETGKVELEEKAEAITAFWARFEVKDTTTGQPETGFLEDELEHLNHIVWSGLREAIAKGDQALIRQVRKTIQECQSQVREAISGEG